jgi:ADP-ribose pyrophosphatase
MALNEDGGGRAESAWRRLGSEVVHHNRWFDVRRDEVVRPNGGRGVYSHVVVPGSATVLAVDDTGQVVFTRQWIYTHGAVQWRLPGGGIEPHDADPVTAARRELAEETGLHAEHWEPLGRVHGADAVSNHVDWVFLAGGLTSHAQALEPGEADLRVVHVPFGEALELVRSGQVPHAGSAYALLTLALRERDGVSSGPVRVAPGNSAAAGTDMTG